jgi:hypothetical protein
VLLIDEIDRADDEFEAFLLEVLTEHAVTIPELGEVRAATPPVVVLTSNRTREVHDALKRRCLYLWLEHPNMRARDRDPAQQAARGARAPRRVRSRGPCRSCATPTCSSRPASPRPWTGPGRCSSIGARHLDPESAARTLGAVLKYREDADRVHKQLDTLLAS